MRLAGPNGSVHSVWGLESTQNADRIHKDGQVWFARDEPENSLLENMFTNNAITAVDDSNVLVKNTPMSLTSFTCLACSSICWSEKAAWNPKSWTGCCRQRHFMMKTTVKVQPIDENNRCKWCEWHHFAFNCAASEASALAKKNACNKSNESWLLC